MKMNFRKKDIHLTFKMLKKTLIKWKDTFWKDISHEKLLNNIVEIKITERHKRFRF